MLAAHKVEYVLIGGSALLVHGIGARETYDVDIVPNTATDNLERLGAALRELGARVITAWVADSQELHVEESTLEAQVFIDNPVLHLLTGDGRMDVLLRPSGATGGFDDLAPGARARQRGDLEIAVAAVPDLILMKEAAGRPRDLEDLVLLRAELARLEVGGPRKPKGPAAQWWR